MAKHTEEHRRRSMIGNTWGHRRDFVRGEAAGGPEARCQWIEGEYPKATEIVDGVDPDACKCMAPTVKRSSWCQYHLDIIYQSREEQQRLRSQAAIRAIAVERTLNVEKMMRSGVARNPHRSHTPGAKGPGRDGW